MRLPNGYGSIIYLGKKRRKPYAVRITSGFAPKGLNANGIMEYKQQYKYLGYFAKRTEALSFLLEYNKNPYDLDIKTLTFADVYERWSDTHFEKVSDISILNYKSAYSKCTNLYKMPFKDIKTNHLQAVIDENKSSPSSVRTLKVVLKHLYKYALKNEIVEKDYSSFIELPKKEKKKDKIPFSKYEINNLWLNTDVKFVDLLLILLYSGMRITELLEIKISDINLKERYLVGGIKTAAGKNRIIPIHKRLVPLIENKIFTNANFLFENTKQGKYRYNNLNVRIVPTLKQFNLEHHTLHETRHTFISQAKRLNIDDLLIKRIVGHSTTDITDNYTHLTNDDLIQAIDLFEY